MSESSGDVYVTEPGIKSCLVLYIQESKTQRDSDSNDMESLESANSHILKASANKM